MKVYHLTRKKDLTSMRDNGILPHSYWSDFHIVQNLMVSDVNEVIICTDTEKYNFVVNYEVAKLMVEGGYISKMPDPKDYKSGFFNCNGLICEETIFDFEIINEEDYHQLYNEAIDYKL